MKYIIRGRLCANICTDRKIDVTDAAIRLYRHRKDQHITELAVAKVKETFRPLEEKEVKAKEKYLIAETTTDQEGAFEFILDDKEHQYQGEAVELDIAYAKVPDYGQANAGESKSFQATITTIQPRWRETNEGLIAGWNYCFPSGIWCYILRWLDIWVICGRVTICDTDNAVPGIEVIAMDDDLITDDWLGQATTDANGRFCIYYTSKDFKKTFLSPFINVETPFSATVGPDVYFKFSRNGVIFYEENVAVAKQPPREDIGHCFCVRLCIPEGIDIPPPAEVTAAFFEIGQGRRYHIVTNIDAATGRTTGKSIAAWNDMAFFSNISLIGSLSKKLDGQPMEYLFEYREYILSGGSFTPVTGWQEVTSGQIANTVIGYTEQTTSDPENPILKTDYAIHPVAGQQMVNFNGNWIQMPQIASFFANQNGVILNLKTTELASGNVDMSGLVPGSSTGTLQQNRYFRLRMKKRQTGSATVFVAGTSLPVAIFNTVYQNVPQNGSWLPNTSNELGVASIDLDELSGGGCADISTSLTVKYTAAMPNLGGVSLSMTGPGGPHSFDPIVFTTPGQEAHGTSSYAGNVASLPDCAYIVRISAELQLTNGETQHANIWDEVAFCKG